MNVCALLLASAACGCGVRESRAAPRGAAAPAPRAEADFWDADRYYWESFWTAFPDGEGLDDREAFDSLPIVGLIDPLLIEIDTICAEYHEDRQRLLGGAAGGAPGTPHDAQAAALRSRLRRDLLPALERAKARYGLPGP